MGKSLAVDGLGGRWATICRAGGLGLTEAIIMPRLSTARYKRGRKPLPPPPPPSDDPRTIEELRELADYITGEALAFIIGVSAGRIAQLVTAGVFERDSEGRLPKDETLRRGFVWMRERNGESEMGKAKQAGIELDNEIKRAALAQARKEAVPVGVIEKAWGHCFLQLRQDLLGLPNRIAGRVAFLKSEGEIEVEVQKQIDEALVKMAKAPELEDEAKIKEDSE